MYKGLGYNGRREEFLIRETGPLSKGDSSKKILLQILDNDESTLTPSLESLQWGGGGVAAT